MTDPGAVDVDELLREITAEEPCGSNLEYDPSFLELEQEVKGKPEVQYGGTVTPATPPDWKIVNALSLQLFKRSRDLRIAVPYARALLKLQGMIGFAGGMSLIERMLDTHWDTIHPQLDAGDDFDPMLRINTLAALVESATILRDVRDAHLVASRAHGRFSLRDIDIATGEMDLPKGEEKPSLAVIDAALMDVDLHELQSMHQALEQVFASNVRIEQILTEKVGVGQALDLSALTKMLKRAKDFIHERLARRSGVDEVAEAVAIDAADDASGAHDATVAVPRSGEIANRDDVVKMLEKICAYYAKYEPSSPVPLLLLRAQRLATKSFVEILQDLAPDSLTQVYQISGTQKES